MKVSLILLSIFTFSAFGAPKEKELRYNNNQTVCIEDVSNMGHLNFFTWSAKQILDALARSEFLTEREWKAIEQNPEIALHLKTAADLALEISESLCPYDKNGTQQGVYGSDDEVDAARHFIMSAYLSFKLGKEKARRFMSTHEDNQFENSNMMDYYNNELGFNYGEALVAKHQRMGIRGRSKRLFVDEVKAEILRRQALPRGNREDFIVLASGPSVCAKRKYPNF